MGNGISILVTILCGGHNYSLLRCALKIDPEKANVPDDFTKHYMSPEYRQLIHGLLPLHVQSAGPVVEIEPIFEVTDLT